MVSNRLQSSFERWSSAHRGQLLLVGALVIAITIVALALVINTVLYTEAVGTEQETGEINKLNEFTFETGKTARSILLRVNHDQRNRTESELAADVNQSFDGYRDGLARSFAIERSVYAKVTYIATSTMGTRVVQTKDRNFSEPGDEDDGSWEIIPGPSGTDIGWFLLNVDLQDTSIWNTSIAVEGPDELLTFSLKRTQSGSADNLSVFVSNNSGQVVDTATCRPVGDRVLVDLYHGTGPIDGCEFVGIEEYLSPPNWVTVDNGTEITGQYGIVSNRSWTPAWSGYVDCDSNPSTALCISPAIWEGSIDLTYRSDSAQYHQRRNVSVYGGRP